MLVFFLVLALLIWLVVKGVSVKFFKFVIQTLILFGGIYFLITDVQHWHKYEYGLLYILFYIIFYLIAVIAAGVWRMVDMSSDEIKADVKNAIAMSKRCPRCLKKLPSYFTSKCPHCTADL